MIRALDEYAKLRSLEFDQVFTVGRSGAVHDGPADLYAPDVFDDDELDIAIDGAGWEALTGYTGQHGYNGPVMHASEYVGGGLADDILTTPGTYVLVVVNALPDDDDDDPEPAGWAILRRTTD